MNSPDPTWDDMTKLKDAWDANLREFRGQIAGLNTTLDRMDSKVKAAEARAKESSQQLAIERRTAELAEKSATENSMALFEAMRLLVAMNEAVDAYWNAGMRDRTNGRHVGAISAVQQEIAVFLAKPAKTEPEKPDSAETTSTVRDELHKLADWISKLPIPTEGATFQLGRVRRVVEALEAALLPEMPEPFEKLRTELAKPQVVSTDSGFGQHTLTFSYKGEKGRKDRDALMDALISATMAVRVR